jgi:hypothetical protein
MEVSAVNESCAPLGKPIPGGWSGMGRDCEVKRDEIGTNHHHALARCLSMIFSENRFTLFRIML